MLSNKLYYKALLFEKHSSITIRVTHKTFHCVKQKQHSYIKMLHQLI